VGEWKVEEPHISVIEGAKGLVAKSKSTHHAISAPFSAPIDFSHRPLVVQYEVKYQKGGNCGGGYLKLLEDGFQNSGKEFEDKTPWVIMFGPDLTCPGSKIHFIFRHKNPKTGVVEEKHLKKPPLPNVGKLTNLYTLVVHPNQTFNVYFNGDSVESGSLLQDFEPPVNPPQEIDDSEDEKPGHWVDDKRIWDPDARKPDDWDEDAPYEIVNDEAEKPEGWLDHEPLSISDPDALKPEEWDDEEDGDWIPPTVPNPKCSEGPGCGTWKQPMKANPAYRGKWFAPMIDNPAYKGEWKPRQIPNPNYFEDLQPSQSLPKIGGVGIELWTTTEDILFSNIYIGHSIEDAATFAEETFHVKRPLEVAEEKEREKVLEDDSEVSVSFRENPVEYVRQKVFKFIDLVKVDPLLAFKTQPETGLGLVGALFTLFGMLGALVGLVGGSQKPITKSPKKKDDEKKEEKKPETDPVASKASGVKVDDAGLTKRK
jgi:hypothetical protein